MSNKLYFLFAVLIAFSLTACKKLAVVEQPDPPVAADEPCSDPPAFAWVAQIGGDSDNFPLGIDVDQAANVYSYGSFRHTIDFDPGASVFNLTAAPDVTEQSVTTFNSSVYLQKLDSAGKFVSAKIELLKFHNIRLIYGAGGDVFKWYADSIFKYNAARVLQYTLAPQNSAGYEEHYSGVTTDATGNIYIAGFIYLNRTYGKYGNVINPGTFSAYLKKLDTNGNPIWIKSNLTDAVADIGIDGQGNIYGFAEQKSAIKKFDPAGNLQLTTEIQKGLHASNIQFGTTAFFDSAGNGYFTGNFTGTVDFDKGPKVFNLTARDQNMFLQKIDASGKFVWAIQFINVGTYEYDSLASIASLTVDSKNNIYLTGKFFGTVNFDPGTGTHTLTKEYAEYFSQKATDAFVLKLNQCH